MVDHTAQEALEAVQAADAGADSIIAFVDSLKEQLADALDDLDVPADVQAAINSVFDISKGTATKIAAAVNTPPVDEPPVVVDPPVVVPPTDPAPPVVSEPLSAALRKGDFKPY